MERCHSETWDSGFHFLLPIYSCINFSSWTTQYGKIWSGGCLLCSLCFFRARSPYCRRCPIPNRRIAFPFNFNLEQTVWDDSIISFLPIDPKKHIPAKCWTCWTHVHPPKEKKTQHPQHTKQIAQLFLVAACPSLERGFGTLGSKNPSNIPLWTAFSAMTFDVVVLGATGFTGKLACAPRAKTRQCRYSKWV